MREFSCGGSNGRLWVTLPDICPGPVFHNQETVCFFAEHLMSECRTAPDHVEFTCRCTAQLDEMSALSDEEHIPHDDNDHWEADFRQSQAGGQTRRD